MYKEFDVSIKWSFSVSLFFFSACNLRSKRKWRNNIFELESASSAE